MLLLSLSKIKRKIVVEIITIVVYVSFHRRSQLIVFRVLVMSILISRSFSHIKRTLIFHPFPHFSHSNSLRLIRPSAIFVELKRCIDLFSIVSDHFIPRPGSIVIPVPPISIPMPVIPVISRNFSSSFSFNLKNDFLVCLKGFKFLKKKREKFTLNWFVSIKFL